MKKEKIIIGFMVMAFAMSIWFMFFAPRKKAVVTPVEIGTPPPVPQEVPSQKIKAPPPPTVPATPPKTSLLEKTNKAGTVIEDIEFQKQLQSLSLASIERMRREVMRNPHITPPSVVANSEKIKDLYKKVSNFHQAESLMETLEKCTDTSSTTAAQVQIVCLNYARRLSGDYKSLSSMYEAMEAQSSDQVREIHSVVSGLSN